MPTLRTLPRVSQRWIERPGSFSHGKNQSHRRFPPSFHNIEQLRTNPCPAPVSPCQDLVTKRSDLLTVWICSQKCLDLLTKPECRRKKRKQGKLALRIEGGDTTNSSGRTAAIGGEALVAAKRSLARVGKAIGFQREIQSAPAPAVRSRLYYSLRLF